jgi:hypothetical protein
MHRRNLATACLVLLGSLSPLGCSGSVLSPNPSDLASTSSGLTVGGPTCTADGVLEKEADQVCAKQMETVSSFKGDEACGMGESHVATFDCTSAAPPPPPPPPPQCTALSVAEMQCTPDGALEKQAVVSCAAEMGMISGFTPDEACGMGSSRTAKYECCVGPSSPPPPPPPPQCNVGVEVGAQMQCTADGALEKQAVVSCAAEMGMISAFTPDEACGMGSSRTAKYECCVGSSSPPPPPPSKCTPAVETQMQCAADAVLEKEAQAACAQEMGTVDAFTPDEACGMGSSLTAKYECCL